MKTLTCVVQARLKSERVPEKMIRPFAGSCLLEIALRKLLQCRHLSPERIYLSAYEDEIKAVGRRVGVQIYNRTLESTYEPVTGEKIWDYINHVPSDYYMTINACNPLLRVETLDRAIDYFQTHDIPSLFSVVKRRNFFFDAQSHLVNKFNGDPKYLKTIETKLVEPLYEAAHSIYIWTGAYMRKHWGYWSFSANDPYLFEMPEDECFDIDYPWQLELAEAMYPLRFPSTVSQRS